MQQNTKKQYNCSIRGGYTSLVKNDRAHYSVEEKIFKLQDKLLSPNINQEKAQDLLKTLDHPKADYQFFKLGDQVPNFQLYNAHGELKSLKEYLKNGKVILSFFRGGWCPYCYLELRAFQKLLPIFKKYGAQVVAVSSEKPDYCLNTTERNGLEFDVLSDIGNKVAKSYNLLFKSKTNLDLWNELGLNKAISNGDLSYELPIPATYIIDEWMTVAYAFTNPDYRKRARPQELIDCLKAIKNPESN
jgi:peroxiredoxin